MTAVAVVGIGAVSAAGEGADALWDAAREGRSCIGPIPGLLPGRHLVQRGGAVVDVELDGRADRRLAPFCDRFAKFALIAAGEAAAQSGLDEAELAGPRVAVVLGTGVGGAEAIEAGIVQVYTTDDKRPDPRSVPRLMPSAIASLVGMRFGATGTTFAVASACSSSTQAIGIAAGLIRAGLADIAITGGSEACLTPAGMLAWETLRVMSPDACRPFSLGRTGMMLGEGAGILVLEKAERATARGARPLAWISGYGTTADAVDMIRPDVGGASRAMLMAVADAGLAPGDIDHVNAHGTGTVANDANEAAALRLVFGDRCDRMPVSSTKPVHGHALGATGALEAIVTIGALRDGLAPPTANFLEAAPDCPVDIVVGQARPVAMRHALKNSFAFGGINACLVLSRAGD